MYIRMHVFEIGVANCLFKIFMCFFLCLYKLTMRVCECVCVSVFLCVCVCV